MAKIIGIIQVKGGAGRSTVATNLAAILARKAPTALVDCDMPQGTSMSWYALRSAETPAEGLVLATARDHKELVGQVQGLEAPTPAIAILDLVVANADDVDETVTLHGESGRTDGQFVLDEGE